jgi:hypothetical protein
MNKISRFESHDFLVTKFSHFGVMIKKLLYLFTILFGLLMTFLIASGFLAYLYAVYLEDQWMLAKPKTKAELEVFLHCYSTQVIQPSESLWGNGYKLRKNERMVQYLILWNAPLDVVYDSENNIKAIYTSYE